MYAIRSKRGLFILLAKFVVGLAIVLVASSFDDNGLTIRDLLAGTGTVIATTFSVAIALETPELALAIILQTWISNIVLDAVAGVFLAFLPLLDKVIR